MEDLSYYNVYKDGDSLVIGDTFSKLEYCVDDLDYYPKEIYLYTIKIVHGISSMTAEEVSLCEVIEEIEESNRNEAQYEKDVRLVYNGGVL